MSTMHEIGAIPAWTLGDRLSKAMRSADVSNQEMADHLGLSRNTISSYTHDKARVPRTVLMAWALRTGVPLEWIETGNAPTGDDGGIGADDGTRTRNILLGRQRLATVITAPFGSRQLDRVA